MNKDVIDLIGNTKMVKIDEMNKETNSDIFIKLEGTNPGGSIKDRPVKKMFELAEKRGNLKPGDTVIEPTSGNTGIAIALISKVKGYNAILVMPETMTEERINLMKMYGAEIILTDGSKGMNGSIELAEKLRSENDYLMLDQFKNEGNYLAHYQNTGEEIIEQLMDIDIFAAGVGTGGTVTGVGKKLKEYNKGIKVVALEPANSAVLSGEEPGSHKISGIGAGFIPEIMDTSVIDEVIKITDDEAFDHTKQLLDKEGLFTGISTGANIAGALKLAKRYSNKKIVTVSPDNGWKYMSVLDYAKEDHND
ncbi:MAG TPA: cysteine synthase A [Halanaerobiales bacterium]|nr:cysteine synthase A [Halanaerobiales bacterium]